MDAIHQGLNLDSVILALFLMAIAALGAIIMVFGTNIRKDISRLFDKMDEHAEADNKRFSESAIHRAHITERLAKIEGHIGERK